MPQSFPFFSHNGTILSAEQAVIPLSSVEYSYGYGVYETIRVSKGRLYFPDEHTQRLMESAKTIALEHEFSADFVKKSVQELLAKNQAETCNIKVLLIGGATMETANLYIMCLNPLFPDRKLYTQGATSITYHYEREFLAAKTLNMLSSYLAYRQARKVDAYDALLVNQRGYITEGTRTNFFTLKGRTIVSPKSTDILPGVTRAKVLGIATQNGFEVIEQDIKLADMNGYDGAFLTSTSSKILPLRAIDAHTWKTVPPHLLELMGTFNQYLAHY